MEGAGGGSGWGTLQVRAGGRSPAPEGWPVVAWKLRGPGLCSGPAREPEQQPLFGLKAPPTTLTPSCSYFLKQPAEVDSVCQRAGSGHDLNTQIATSEACVLAYMWGKLGLRFATRDPEGWGKSEGAVQEVLGGPDEGVNRDLGSGGLGPLRWWAPS